MNFIKDPTAVLDYAFDWATWLGDGETITEATVTADDGLTINSTSFANGRVVTWLSGGTALTNYAVNCLIVTSLGRADSRSVHVNVRNR